MRKQVPLIDGYGDLNLHVLADLVLPVRGGSSLPDLTGRQIEFHIPSRGIKHVLEAHFLEPTWKVINLPASRLKDVRTHDSFILLDRTNGGSVPLWEGKFVRRD